MTTMTTPSTVCPDWCSSKHDVDSEHAHVHEDIVSGGSAAVDVMQVVEFTGAAIHAPEPLAYLWWRGNGDLPGLTAAECRHLAEVMVAAAEWMDAHLRA